MLFLLSLLLLIIIIIFFEVLWHYSFQGLIHLENRLCTEDSMDISCSGLHGPPAAEYSRSQPPWKDWK